MLGRKARSPSKTSMGKGIEERLQCGVTITIILTYFLKDEGGAAEPGLAGVPS